MPAPPIPVEPFYRAALLGLLFLEAREGRGRRFGEAAHAAWKALGGELEDRDRLDLLVRDAAVSYPLAFAPRAVFELPGLSDDEPFGPDWAQAPKSLAAQLVREGVSAVPSTLGANLVTGAAAIWSLSASVKPSMQAQAATMAPATRVVAAGAGAVVALVRHAADRRDLDLADQVLFVTASPGERQQFGMALLATGTRTKPRVVAPAEATVERMRARGLTHVDLVLVSDDADEEAREAAKQLGKELAG